MKITKFGHSCVLVETENRVGLFDPGVWSHLDVNALPQIDRLIITHEHNDHMDADLIKKIIKSSPQLHIVANQAVTNKLKQAGIEANYRGEETACTKPFSAPHEELPVPGSKIPDNTGFHFKDRFSHPGDSHSFNETKDILALPVIAPWGSTVNAVKIALELKPKFVVPIHDVMYKREARDWLYDMLERAFKDTGIKLICRVNGESVEV